MQWTVEQGPIQSRARFEQKLVPTPTGRGDERDLSPHPMPRPPQQSVAIAAPALQTRRGHALGGKRWALAPHLMPLGRATARQCGCSFFIVDLGGLIGPRPGRGGWGDGSACHRRHARWHRPCGHWRHEQRRLAQTAGARSHRSEARANPRLDPGLAMRRRLLQPPGPFEAPQRRYVRRAPVLGRIGAAGHGHSWPPAQPSRPIRSLRRCRRSHQSGPRLLSWSVARCGVGAVPMLS